MLLPLVVVIVAVSIADLPVCLALTNTELQPFREIVKFSLSEMLHVIYVPLGMFETIKLFHVVFVRRVFPVITYCLLPIIAFATALQALTSPYPTSRFQEPSVFDELVVLVKQSGSLVHVDCMMLLTSLLVNDGFLSRISAAIPATNGVAAEVPSKIFV